MRDSGRTVNGARRDRGRTGQIVPALALLAVPALAFANPSLEYEGGLALDSPVVRPSAVSTSGSATSICVTDEATGTLDVFDAHGFHRYRTDESSGVRVPLDGLIDLRDRFVYLESGSGVGVRTIRRLTFLGEPDAYEAEVPFERWAPSHLALGTDGHYLAVDGTGVLTKHDAETGALVWQVRIAQGDFERVDLVGRPVQVPDGRIYVPHSGLQQVLVATDDGRYEGSFGVPGAKQGELAAPVSAAAVAGRLLVLDRMRHRVLVYDAEHEFVGESLGFGSGPGDLYHPVSIAASPDGVVFIAQGFEGRVQRYRLLDTEFARKSSGGSR